MLKFLVLLIAFILGLRLLARFFLRKVLRQATNSQRFDPFSSAGNTKKASSKPDFDRIQDADYEDITEPEKD
jgi:hypothetical protein